MLFRTLNTDHLQLPARLSAYVIAFKALHPHHLPSVTAVLPSDILYEPLFFDRQISQPATSSAATNSACPSAAFLTPQQSPLMLSAGITKMAPLTAFTTASATPAADARVEFSFPLAWRAVVSSASTSKVSSSFGLRKVPHSRCSDRPSPQN